MSIVREVVDRITTGVTTDREKAIALHDYVRDNIKFGFTKYFDAAKPDYTLDCGVGHCNPQGALMVTLLQEVGMEAHQHFVVLPKDILKDVVPLSTYAKMSAELSHCYTEVKIEGTWYNIDSYILDTPLLSVAQAKLVEEGRSLGYGTRVDSTNHWDGKSDSFSQFDEDLMIEDHGRVDDLEAFFHSSKYRHKKLGIQLNTIFKLMGNSSVAKMNAHIEGLRRQFSKD